MTIAPEARVAPTAASASTPKFDPTKPFRTRDGDKVENFCAIAFEGEVGNERYAWHANGSWSASAEEESRLDLVNVAPTGSPAPAAGVSEAEVELRKRIAQEVYDFMCISGDRQERVIGMALMSVIAPTPISAEAIAWGHEVAERVEADRASGKTRPLAEFRAELEARRLARPPAHDTGEAEPVAWQWQDAAGRWTTAPESVCREIAEPWEVRALYAAPQPPVPGGQSDGWWPTWQWRWAYDLSTSGWAGAFDSQLEAHEAALNHSAYQPHFEVETRPAPTPAPSNAGEDEAAFVDWFEERWIPRSNPGLQDRSIERLIALARRGLNVPTRPAGDEVTETMVEAALDHQLGEEDWRSSSLVGYLRVEMRETIAAALRARTGQ